MMVNDYPWGVTPKTASYHASGSTLTRMRKRRCAAPSVELPFLEAKRACPQKGRSSVPNVTPERSTTLASDVLSTLTAVSDEAPTWIGPDERP